MGVLTGEVLLYYLGSAFFVFFLVMLMVTGSMYGHQKNTPSRPNEYLPDRLIYYSSGFSKKLKAMSLITFSGYLVILPTAVAYGVSRVYLTGREWLPAVITFAAGLMIMILIGSRPFSFKESCLIIDEQKVTVRYKDGEREDKVFYISQYDHYIDPARHRAPMLVFTGNEGKEELSLHFLRINDAVAAGRMVEFIKRNGRVPVINQVGSKQEAKQLIKEKYKAEVEAFAKSQQELFDDEPRYRIYLENTLSKIPPEEKEKIKDLCRQGRKLEAIKECREFTREGLRIAKDLVERYIEPGIY